ncbi:MAG TPA: response regulator transcription factor [Polyangiaceae bacterium]|nr:response regulator transcription factor [Polyangiaceae bacterium]
MRVLVVDDDEETRRLLVRNLQLASHGVKAVESCADARDALAHDRFDVVVLDVMLPDGSGIDLCSQLREAQVEVPILLLTAKGEVRSRVLGLEAGADDYLGKPFAISELRARVMALGRRGPLWRDRSITIGALRVEVESRTVLLDDAVVPLTARELAIVNLLATRPGRIVTREELFESVWGEASDSARASLDVLVGRIRRKLGQHGSMLHTVRGVGYRLEAES